MNNYLRYLKNTSNQTFYEKDTLTEEATETALTNFVSATNGYSPRVMYKGLSYTNNSGTLYVHDYKNNTTVASTSIYSSAILVRLHNYLVAHYNNSLYLINYDSVNNTVSVSSLNYGSTKNIYDMYYYKNVYYILTADDVITTTDFVTFTSHNLNLTNVFGISMLADTIYITGHIDSTHAVIYVYDLEFTLINTFSIAYTYGTRKTLIIPIAYGKNLYGVIHAYDVTGSNTGDYLIRINLNDGSVKEESTYLLPYYSYDVSYLARADLRQHYRCFNPAGIEVSFYHAQDGNGWTITDIRRSIGSSVLGTNYEKKMLTSNISKSMYEAIFDEIKVNVSGSHVTLANISSNRTEGSTTDNYYKLPSDSAFRFSITPDTSYRITSISSTVENAVITNEGSYYTIEYPEEYYIEDTITVVTQSGVDLLPSNRSLKNTFTLTESFETSETSIDNFLISEDTLYPFKALKFEDDALYMLSNEEWVKIWEDSWIIEMNYIKINETISSVTSEFNNNVIGSGIYDYFYKGFNYAYTTNLEEFSIALSHNSSSTEIIHITRDEYTQSDVDYYIILGNDYTILYLDFVVNEGYKIDQFETNVGTFATNRLSIPQSELRQNLTVEMNIVIDGDSFKCRLYNMKDDINVANKTITDALEIECNLVENTSIINPSLICELTLVPPKYNYVYIPLFDRYYFIDNYINVGFKLWRLNLTCDTLTTSWNVIKSNNAYVLRSSSNYDEKLEDEMLPKYSKRTFTEVAVTNYRTFNFNTLFTWHYLIVLRDISSFDMTINESVVSYTAPYIINGIKKDVNGVYTTLTDSTVGDDTDLILIVQSYDDVIKYINDNSLQSHLRYVMSLPESALDLFDTLSNEINSIVINFDNSHSYTTFGVVARSYPRKILYTTCDLSSKTKELYRDDYKINVYLPFFGMTDIDKNKVGTSLDIYYYLDITNGVANVSIESGNQIILAQQCNLGIKIGIDENDENEINKQREMIQTQQTTNNITSAITMIGSIVSLIGGLALSTTGAGTAIGFGAVVGGIAGLGASMNNIVSKNVISEKQMNNLYISSTSILGTGNSSLYLPNSVKVYINEPEIVLSSTGVGSDYLNRFGKPLKQFVTLATLTGYVQIGEIDLKNLELTKSEIQNLREILYRGFYIKSE